MEIILASAKPSTRMITSRQRKREKDLILSLKIKPMSTQKKANRHSSTGLKVLIKEELSHFTER